MNNLTTNLQDIFPGLEIAVNDTKVCGVCNIAKTLDNYNRDGGANYLRYLCKQCEREQNAAARAAKKTAPPVPDDHVCPICNKNEEQAKGNNIKNRPAWCADHDHKSGTFRGWLCHKCNTALGLLNDNVLALNNAEKYLKKFEEKQSKSQSFNSDILKL